MSNHQVAGSSSSPSMPQKSSSSSSPSPGPSTSRSRPASLDKKPPTFDLANFGGPLDPRFTATRSSSKINLAVGEILALENLPEVPDDLKTHVAAYVQRARELSSKDPVMCYWCLYFAAKRGVVARTSRHWLFKLMDALEMVKRELRDDDAVATEEAGHAYIENFALKVFNLADAEDQAGATSRSTAKKFLAASNFFEMLSVFEGIPEHPENKQRIKYAKWKAAAIARGDDSKSQMTLNSQPTSTDTRSSTAVPRPPTTSILSPKATSPDLLAVNRYLAPPAQGGTSPGAPSTFASLPTSLASSANPSPPAEQQVPLPPSPNPASPKLPSPQLAAQRGGNLAEPPATKLPEPMSQKALAEKYLAEMAASKPPVASAPAGRPRRQTNEDIPSSKSGFFGAISKVFGSRDGQTTPGGWSNQATPGTEDTFRLPAPFNKLEAKEKGPSPLSGTPATAGAGDRAQSHARQGSLDSASRSVATASSLGKGDGRPELLRKPELSTNTGGKNTPVATQAAPSAPVELAKQAKPRTPSPVRGNTATKDNRAPTAYTASASTRKQEVSPSRDAVAVQASVSAQNQVGGGAERVRRFSDDKHHVRREDVFPLASRVTEPAKVSDMRAAAPPPPLSAKPAPIPMMSRIAALKKVHFTGSVKGGLSSVASTSPPASPVRESFGRDALPTQREVKVDARGNYHDSSDAAQTSETNDVPRGRPLSMSMVHEPKSSLSPLTPSQPLKRQGSTGSNKNVASNPQEKSSQPTQAPRASPPTLPLPLPVGRQRAQSFGQPSSAGSVGSFSTLAHNDPSSRPVLSQPAPNQPTPKATPMPIPSVSSSRTAVPVPSQQPTPSPSPPKSLPLAPSQLMASPASRPSPIPTVPSTPASTTASLLLPANNKSVSAHPPTPYTRTEDIPAALSAEFMLNAKKHTQYAMSALQYDDIETARRELLHALQSLDS